jgi:hypothetical protein
LVLETTVLPTELFSCMRMYFKEIKNRLILTFLSQISVGLSLYHYKHILLFSTVYPVLVLEEASARHFVVTDILELTSIYLELLSFLNLQVMAVVFSYRISVQFNYSFYFRPFNLVQLYRVL